MTHFAILGSPACSPHPRGWSLEDHARSSDRQVLPAPAGMVPRHRTRSRPRPGAPRTRGDGPGTRDHAARTSNVLPAPAGMVPPWACTTPATSRAPRTRGDGPPSDLDRDHWLVCSPHPRGWSPDHPRQPCPVDVLPAPAGMVPSAARTPTPPSSAPRTRGDGPRPDRRHRHRHQCSPHPRGWSPGAAPAEPGTAVLPAPAGMVPTGPTLQAWTSRAPRTRGDGPVGDVAEIKEPLCSPHPRGWSRALQRLPPHHLVLPAPAGMVPRVRPCRARRRSAPRTRGDGPYYGARLEFGTECSPHPRGWSPMVALEGPADAVLPAPAGMVPPADASP